MTRKKEWVDRVSGRVEVLSDLVEISGSERLHADHVRRELAKLELPFLAKLDTVLYQGALAAAKTVLECGS